MSSRTRSDRRRVELRIRSALLDAASEYSVDMEAAAEEGIKAAVERRWLDEKREAIEASNRWVEENGLPLAKYRSF